MSRSIKESTSALRGYNLSKSYKDGKLKTTVLSDVNLDVLMGEKVGIVGLSGSGKTTLLNLLAGLDKPSCGEVYLAGNRFDLLSANRRALLRNKHLGFIYQFHHLLPEFSALDNVIMPLMMRKKTNKKENYQKGLELLTAVGLAHRKNHKPSELSGGERQRVAIARALVTNPSCVLADEPTGNLDNHNSQLILDLIDKLSQQYQISFVVVTHDFHFADKMDRVYKIEDGCLYLNKPTKEHSK